MSYGANVVTYDPWASVDEVKNEFDIPLDNKLPKKKFDAIVLTVAHSEFLSLDLRAMLKPSGVLYDVKSVVKGKVDGRL